LRSLSDSGEKEVVCHAPPVESVEGSLQGDGISLAKHVASGSRLSPDHAARSIIIIGVLFTAGPVIRERQPQPADDIQCVEAIATYRFYMDGKPSPSDAPLPVLATLVGLTFVTGASDGV